MPSHLTPSRRLLPPRQSVGRSFQHMLASSKSGTSVALKCATTSTYAPITYSFFKRTTGIEYDIISQSGDTYTMENISTDDSGYYKCSVTMNSKESYRSTGHTIEVVGEYMVKVESIVFNPIV